MSHINLLPWREERILQKNNIFYVCCVIVAILAVVVIFFGNSYLKILVSMQNKDNNYLDSQITYYQGKIKEIDGLKERKKLR